jgi:hypothetical protein
MKRFMTPYSFPFFKATKVVLASFIRVLVYLPTQRQLLENVEVRPYP